jgi:hypothetical protein
MLPTMLFRHTSKPESLYNMFLTGLTHRDELFDLTARWLNDDVHDGDGRILSEIFLYEGFISGAFVIPRMVKFLQKSFGPNLHMERVRQKYLMRERLIQYMAHPTERTESLARSFHENPEFFFPRLPIDAVLVTSDEKRLVSIGRIKRLSRLAEKVSFRLMDALFKDIKTEAEGFASKRAALAGLPLSSFISSPDVMEQDFVDAERAIAGRFREKSMEFDREAFVINDMLGFKIIVEPDETERLLEGLEAESEFRIVEVQTHSGRYNAVNLSIDLALPDPRDFTRSLSDMDWSLAAQRGLNPELAKQGFQDYIERGSSTLRTEIILTTYPELMESEFGRSLHELRILRLRDQTSYRGLIAQNAGYLIEYMLTLAMSPVTNVPFLPIKIYGRYLPETIYGLKNDLFGSNLDGSLLNAFCMICQEEPE